MEKQSRRKALAAFAAAIAGVAAFGAKAFSPGRRGTQGSGPMRAEDGGREAGKAARRLGPAPGTVKRGG